MKLGGIGMSPLTEMAEDNCKNPNCYMPQIARTTNRVTNIAQLHKGMGDKGPGQFAWMSRHIKQCTMFVNMTL